MIFRIVLVWCAVSHAAKVSRSKVDPDTPPGARNTTSLNGNIPGHFRLIFSDEFNEDGRNFKEGQEPYWTAPDVWNRATNDQEYYSSSMVTTEGGNLVITAVDQPTIPDCPYTSGALYSWNQMCFTGGIVEFRAQLPGDAVHKGWWPAVWMMGNLGKLGHPDSLNSMWPWSYNVCDANHQWQRISACNDTPGEGLNPNQGRGVPEIDILESRIGGAPNHPYTYNMSAPTLMTTYHFTPKNPTGAKYKGGMHLNNDTQMLNVDGDGLHDFIGSITPIHDSFFTGMHTYRLEWFPGDHISWYVDDVFVFTLKNETLRKYSTAAWTVGQRLISEEPMYLIMNLAISPMWGLPDPGMVWPGFFKMDYMRVYQQPGKEQDSCDPASHPTKEYIEAHPAWYYN